jgi:integrase
MNVDFVSHRLTITHSLWRGQLVSPKTRASERTIHLAEVLADLLLDHRQKSAWGGESDYVFCGESGAPLDPDNLRHRVLYPALEAVGIKRQDRMHGFHLFRHSAGSIVHALTRDLKAAQELLGHSRISTTSDIYVHLDKSVAEEATEALANAIIPNCGLLVVQRIDRIQ